MKMKYRQACQLKKQLDNTIDKLMRNVAGPGMTGAMRTRLAITHMSLVSLIYDPG